MAYDQGSDSESSFAEDNAEDNSEDDYTIGKKRKHTTNARGRKKVKSVPKPTYVAQVTETANDGVDASESTSRVDKADSHILAKIRKAMGLAAHPGTGEAEAKAAMRMATKLMQTQNLTQADLIANETAEERLTRAGQSTVSITSTQDKMVRCQRWYNVASDAVCEAFDVQTYSESFYEYLNWVFYGLADNTVAAALAFEMLHNQIETWAIERKGELKGQSGGNSYRGGVAERVLREVRNENKKALRKAEEEEKKRVKQESEVAEAARAAEIARLTTPIVQVAEPTPLMTSPKVEEKKSNVSLTIEDIHECISSLLADLSDDDDSDDNGDPWPNYAEGIHMSDDLHADFDERNNNAEDLDLDALEEKIKVKSERFTPPPLARYSPATSVVKPEPGLDALEEKIKIKSERVTPPPLARRCSPATSVVKPEPELSTLQSNSSDVAPSWTSALQLRTFRDNAKTISETYLKDNGIKVQKGPKLKPIKFDRAAYNKGWEDGQRVDLKRRKIEDEESKGRNTNLKRR